MIDLKQLAKDHGYKLGEDETATMLKEIIADEKADPKTREWAREELRRERPWFWRIPCRLGRGHIGVWGEDKLSTYAAGQRMPARPAVLHGVTVVERGDDEVQVAFPPSLLGVVADLLGARRRSRPNLSPERRRELAARISDVRARVGIATRLSAAGTSNLSGCLAGSS